MSRKYSRFHWKSSKIEQTLIRTENSSTRYVIFLLSVCFYERPIILQIVESTDFVRDLEDMQVSGEFNNGFQKTRFSTLLGVMKWNDQRSDFCLLNGRSGRRRNLEKEEIFGANASGSFWMMST